MSSMPKKKSRCPRGCINRRNDGLNVCSIMTDQEGYHRHKLEGGMGCLEPRNPI